MAKDLRISFLMDFYGDMLTDKQKEVVQMYYNEDLSLGEIAQIAEITRQGVRDSIKRAEATLIELEERLGLARKFRQMEDELEHIILCAREIAFDAEEMPQGQPLVEKANEIERIADRLRE